MLRRLLGSALTALVFAVGLVAPASPATAGTTPPPILNPPGSSPCSGTLIDHYHRFNNAVTIYLYYSSANGGTNCAWAQKETRRGTADYMDIWIGRCSTGNPSRCSLEDNITWSEPDYGYFRYYAGPVQITATAGRCIAIYVWYRESEGIVHPTHCG